MKRKVLMSSIILLLFMILLIPKVQAKQVTIAVQTEDLYQLEVESSDTIEAVKNKIQDLTLIPAKHQVLSYKGMVFEEGRTVADYINNFYNEENIIIDVSLKVYQLIYDANGGIGIMENQELQYNEVTIILDNFFVREGHIFDGWNTASDGSGSVYDNGELISIKEDVTLYAQWLPVTFLDEIIVDFTTMGNFSNITDNENDACAFLAFKGLLNPSVDNNLYDKDGKLLFGINAENDIVFAEGLTETDNISYTLTEEDIITYGKDYDVVPRKIEIIFVEKTPKYKVVFDANEGEFKDGTTLTIEKWENGMENTLEIPIRAEYGFLGFFTEKTGGTKLENYIAEAGIDSDLTFYAQWQKLLDGSIEVLPPDSSSPIEDSDKPSDSEPTGDGTSVNPDNTNVGNTNSSNANVEQGAVYSPQTGDNVIIYVIGLIVSTIGLVYITKKR